uniref:ComEC/Rec2 family competence protein n=1 Tax=Pedobacter schmidteae TaxID=2201271 RepID=UPI000EABF709|nr:ComEC/Rec2 family competence protein [Pedobacter schmidteae]
MNGVKTFHKQEIFFVRILAPFSVGILCFYGCMVGWISNSLLIANSLIFIYLFIRNARYKKANAYRYAGINGLIAHVLCFILGSSSVILYNNAFHSDYYALKKSNYLKIRIIEAPQKKPNIILFTALVTKSACIKPSLLTKKSENCIFNTASGKIRISISTDRHHPISLKYGDELIIPYKFVEVPSPLQPSEFDFKAWLAAQNIYHQTYLKPHEVVKTNQGTGNKVIHFALELREKQVLTYRKLIKNDDAFAVAATLILGYRADLTAETLEIYSKTGTIHVLSVSGMHVSLVYLVLNYVLWFLRGNKLLKTLKMLFILGAIWAYTLLTGFSPSVLRAAIMISVLVVAKSFARNTNNYNIIAFAAFCLLLYNPFLVWDIGFQLSFMAVLGLIYLQSKIQALWPIKQFWLAKIWETTAMSLAAQLATYPFSVYYFHQFPIYFLLSNLFITLPAALIMYMGIVILLFKLSCLGPVFEWLICFMNTGLNWIAQLPFSGVTAIWLSKTELTLLCIALLLLITALSEFRKKQLIVALLIFLNLSVLLSFGKMKAFHQKKTIRFTLKKNYAVAIIRSHKALLFTDLNPESKVFYYFIKPALDQHMVTETTFIQP